MRIIGRFTLDPIRYPITGDLIADAHEEVTEDIADAGLKVRFPAKAGMRVVGVAFNRDEWFVEGVGMSRLPPASDGYASGRKTEQQYGRIKIGRAHV